MAPAIEPRPAMVQTLRIGSCGALGSFAGCRSSTRRLDAFIRDIVLPRQQVTVAEAGETIVGFIAVSGEWVEQLYLDPSGQGRHRQPVADASDRCAAGGETALLPIQHRRPALLRASRLSRGVFGDGTNNEEGLPDILYVRRADSAGAVLGQPAQ